MIVVDASVVLAWCFADETNAVADRVLDRLGTETAIAPAIWPLEVANGLRSAQRRGRIDEAEIDRVRAFLLALPIEVEAMSLDVALRFVMNEAIGLDLSAYDAAYLWLARSRGLALATVDDRLATASARVGVRVIA